MKNIVSFMIMMETVYRAAGVLINKTTPSVCQGLTATIDFSINLQGSTYGTGSESWYFGSTRIATNPSGNFSPQGNYSSRLLSYSTYGISLSGVTSTDAGEYLLVFAVIAPTVVVVTATASLIVNIAPASSCVPYYIPKGGTYKCVLNQTAVSNNECGSPILQTNWTNGLGTSDINIATSGNYTCCGYGIAKNCYNGSYTFCETFSITVPTTPTTILTTPTTILTTPTTNDTGADVLPIGAIAGGISGAVVAVVLAILVLIVLRRGGLKSKQKGNDFTRELQTMERPDSGLVDNPVYDSSMSRGAVGAEYAVVVKKTKVDDASNLYAQVDKKTNKKKEGKQGKHGQISRGDVYENSNTKEASSDKMYENPGARSSIGSLVSKDGLFYADLKLDTPSTKNGKPFIRGLEHRTVYAEIAYNKRGEPLPESDNE